LYCSIGSSAKYDDLSAGKMATLMQQKLIRLSQRYALALRRHLKRGPLASLLPARALGGQAVTLGLETLDIARIHSDALATLEASSSRDGIIKRAEIFFAETVAQIEATHHAALKSNARLVQVNKALGQRTVDLAAAHRSLKHRIAQRKSAEKALTTTGGQSMKLLEESRRLHEYLQHLTHQFLSAQEDKRKKISRELQNDIAQTLLGINVRLLSLKQRANASSRDLQKEIASTRRLVDKSMKSIKRFAREFSKHHET
jgi:signal transduction histidine kinase